MRLVCCCCCVREYSARCHETTSFVSVNDAYFVSLGPKRNNLLLVHLMKWLCNSFKAHQALFVFPYGSAGRSVLKMAPTTVLLYSLNSGLLVSSDCLVFLLLFPNYAIFKHVSIMFLWLNSLIRECRTTKRVPVRCSIDGLVTRGICQLLSNDPTALMPV